MLEKVFEKIVLVALIFSWSVVAGVVSLALVAAFLWLLSGC